MNYLLAKHRAIQILNRHQKAIYTIATITANAATVYLSIDAGRKIQREIEQFPPDATNGEKLKRIGKYFIAPVTTATLQTIYAIRTNNKALQRAEELTTIVANGQQLLSNYQEYAAKEIGNNKAENIRNDAAIESMHQHPLTEDTPIVYTGHGSTIVYEVLTGRYFYASIEWLEHCEIELQRNVLANMYCSLNEVYDEINVPQNEVGNMLGFTVDNPPTFIYRYGPISETDKRPCLLLEYQYPPKEDYSRFP